MMKVIEHEPVKSELGLESLESVSGTLPHYSLGTLCLLNKLFYDESNLEE